MNEKAKQVFSMLDIQEKDLPKYKDADSFAKSFKVCTLTKNVYATASNSTAQQNRKRT